MFHFDSVFITGCQFYPPGEYLRFVRVPENLRVGEEVLLLDVFPRRNLSIEPLDKVRNDNGPNNKNVQLLKFMS